MKRDQRDELNGRRGGRASMGSEVRGRDVWMALRKPLCALGGGDVQNKCVCGEMKMARWGGKYKRVCRLHGRRVKESPPGAPAKGRTGQVWGRLETHRETVALL